MKKRRTISILGALCIGAVLLGGTPSWSGEKEKASRIPETVGINLQKDCPEASFGKDKKKVPGFSHRAHAEDYLPGKEAFSENPFTDEFTCSACHKGARTAEEAGKGDICKAARDAGGAMAWFHKTCKGCHKRMKKAGEKTGPVGCKGCHKRASKRRPLVEGC